MGRSSKARVRDVLDEHEGGVSPGAAALAVFALGLGGMIVWNAFFGTHEQGSAKRFVTQIPKGASTHVEVAAPARSTTTVTITYDPQVEDVQRELMATGHYRGLVDGVAGKQTSIAVRNYQKDNQLPVTGEISRQLLDHIRYTRKIAAASEFTGSVTPKVNVAVEPKSKPLAVKQAAKPPAKPAAPKPQGIARVRDVQQKLRKLGYEISAVTGEPDEMTRAAILKFQLDYGLTMDGTISKELLAGLKVAEAALSAAQR
jgi:peptidoglycan hydrolase-like protein with peptidoglycan-binding domain